MNTTDTTTAATTTTPWGLGHLAMVTYHQPTDSYIATCPDCDWTTEPTLDGRSLHAAADAHYAASLPPFEG